MLIDTKPFPGSVKKSVLNLPEIYYTPEQITRFGVTVTLEPSIKDILIKMFMSDGKDRYGYYSGIKGLHDIHGTTQVPAVIDIKSNKVKDEQVYKDGFTTYKIHPSDKNITTDSFAYLEILDCLEDMYDYFEEDIQECIRYIVNKLELKKDKFILWKNNYSYRTMEVIDSVFT